MCLNQWLLTWAFNTRTWIPMCWSQLRQLSLREMCSGVASFKIYSLNLCTPWPATHNVMLNFVDLTFTRPHCLSCFLLAEKTNIGSLGTYVSFALESSTHPLCEWVESGPTLHFWDKNPCQWCKGWEEKLAEHRTPSPNPGASWQLLYVSLSSVLPSHLNLF